jgi:hypothetical protein
MIVCMPAATVQQSFEVLQMLHMNLQLFAVLLLAIYMLVTGGACAFYGGWHRQDQEERV